MISCPLLATNRSEQDTSSESVPWLTESSDVRPTVLPRKLLTTTLRYAPVAVNGSNVVVSLGHAEWLRCATWGHRWAICEFWGDPFLGTAQRGPERIR